MIAVFRLSTEKKNRWAKKTEKMIEVLEEFKECLENGEDYDEEEDDWEEENPQFKAAMRKAVKSAMKSRYSRKGGM